MKKEFYFENLNCANCAKKIEDKIKLQTYVKKCNYNFALQKLSIETEQIRKNDLINELQKIVDSVEEGVYVRENIKEYTQIDNKNEIIKKVTKFVLAIILLIVFTNLQIRETVKIILYIILYIFVGYKVLSKAFKGSLFDENFLMSIASISAFFIGSYEEAIAVMLFYNLGEFLQDLAVDKSRKSIKKALSLKPDIVHVKRNHDIVDVMPEEVCVNDVIVVNPSEKIALDGIVIKGSSEIDTSNITGESEPKFIKEDEKILSGCINISSVLEILVTKEYKDSTVGKILELVENAADKKAKIEKFITKFARIYTPIVVSIAVFIAIFMPLILRQNFSTWIYKACIFLVISCPCALVISVPLGIFAGIGALSKSAIFVKGGNFLEILSEIDTIFFDKTGTLTKSKLRVKKIENYSDFDILQLVASAERYSMHPIAKAIVNNFDGEFVEVENLHDRAGYGLSFKFKNHDILVGNKKLLEENNIDCSINTEDINVYVAIDKKLSGRIDLEDEIRSNAHDNINKLLNLGIDPIILSGDKVSVVQKVAKQIGIKKYFGELLPIDKVEIIKSYMKDKKVAFVGDGTNDAPVLTVADVGIVMKNGSDIAMEASDIVLLKEDLSKVIEAIFIAKKTKKVVYENIILSLTFKILVLLLGLIGIVSMWLAVFADVGVALLAIINSIRVLRYNYDKTSDI